MEFEKIKRENENLQMLLDKKERAQSNIALGNINPS